MEDADAILAVRAGDADAFAHLVRRYTAVAHRTAWLLGAGSEADDVVQDAFVRAYRGLGGFRVDQPFQPWLLRIVANQTRNRYRGERRRLQREATWPEPVPEPPPRIDPAATVAEQDQERHLLGAVAALPQAQRDVVTCRYLLELDEAETAAVLRLPRGTVKSRLSRALVALRGLVDEEAR